MNKEIFNKEQKENVQELFSILNLPENEVANSSNSNELLNYLIENHKFISIENPKNEYEEVNLFDTIFQLFRKADEKLPEYFDEPNICDDCEAMEILQMLNEYYNSEEEKEIMILDNMRDKYIICVVPKNKTDKIYTLSFQTGVPLVSIDDF